jgi:hypothetical protein
LKIGDWKYFVGRGARKLPTLILRPVDILSCLALALNKKIIIIIITPMFYTQIYH